MIYSCFDQHSGRYNYFRDAKQIPINGDLPVPNFLKGRATKLGVPALEAGRPLPSNAQPFGSGLAARGMIVNCKPDRVSLGATLDIDTKSGIVMAAAIGTAALLWYTDQKLSAVAVGGVTLAALVL